MKGWRPSARSTGDSTGPSRCAAPTFRKLTAVCVRSAFRRWKTKLVLGLDPRIVQGAVAEALNAVYEADFLGSATAFGPDEARILGRSGQGPDDAARELRA